MNLPKPFEEYVQQGIMIKCSINKPRAEFLIMEAEKAFNGLSKNPHSKLWGIRGIFTLKMGSAAEQRGFRPILLNKRVAVMGIDEDNVNSIIKDCYDIMMELIRAKLLLTGYCSAGQFSHEAEISFLKKCGFSEYNVSFMNEVRYFRNSITYYGKIFTIEYAQQVFDFTTKIYPKLRNL